MNWIQYLKTNEVIKAFNAVFIALISWVLLYPLTHLFRRDSNFVIVIGRRGRVFADNSKYFYIYASLRSKVIFFTTDIAIRDAIKLAGGYALLHPSLGSFIALLKCGYIVVDMADWIDYGTYHLSRGAKIIQLWHGSPLKFIELDLFSKRLMEMPIWIKYILKIQKKLIGRYSLYDIVISTSQYFIQDVFSNCFKSKKFLASGYPRNDILLGWPDQVFVVQSLLKINVDNHALVEIQKAKHLGIKIGLFVPTFRKDLNDPFAQEIELIRLSKFAVSHNIIFIFKLHPFMEGKYGFVNLPNLIEYGALKDIYPALPLTDFLITDYSSIYFDYLLLNKPVIVFVPDLEFYLKKDRNMYFEYEKMTPGCKCRTLNELEQHILRILKNNGDDAFAAERAKIANYAFDQQDNHAGKRIWDEMFGQDE